MDWTRIKRKLAKGDLSDRPYGPYTTLDHLIRLQFDVADFSLQPRQPVSSVLSGRYGSKLRGRGLNFEELRHYLQGDDIRTIDWKVTARTRSPHVRVYSEEKDRQVLLLVDQRINMFFGTRNRFKSVTAAELAAIASWRAVASGDRIGAVIFNDRELIAIHPRRSNRTVMSILANIIKMNHLLRADTDMASSPDMFNSALKTIVQMSTKDILIVLISDCDGADSSTEKSITRLAAHNDIIAFLVHDPTRLSLSSQKIALSDGRRHMEIDLGNKKIRNLLLADYQREAKDLARFFKHLSAPFLMISNEGDVTQQVRKLLGVTKQRRTT